MTQLTASGNLRRYPLSGAIAGALSSVSFALIHQLFISNIWYSIVAMMTAGSLCGLCLAWSYGVLTTRPSVASWIRYNGLYVAMLAILGLISVLVFQPVTTIAALIQEDGPPDELFRQALPMTIAFTVATAVVLTLLYRRGWRGFGASLLASTVLVTFLGLNVSVIGLVDIPRGSLYLVLELFGLVFAIMFVYAVLFIPLERKSLIGQNSA
jgi:hypothetical protein